MRDALLHGSQEPMYLSSESWLLPPVLYCPTQDLLASCRSVFRVSCWISYFDALSYLQIPKIAAKWRTCFRIKSLFWKHKNEFWSWEVTEMYRKLILISLIFLFGSERVFQIGLTLLVVSVFGVTYTLFRPIKTKFEDSLKNVVLWVIFFDVCLGAIYSTCDGTKDHQGNDSLIINILFVVLNSSIILVALGNICF